MIVPDTIWLPEIALTGRTKYRALADALRDGVAAGHLPPGTQLLPVRDMAWRLGVTPGTVARAYATLIDAGVLTAGVGRGTFVADKPAPASPPVPPPADAHLRLLSPRLPDLGQGAIIRAGLSRLAASMPDHGLLDYPSRQTDAAARAAFAARAERMPIGPVTPEDVVLANGAQNAIVMVMQALLTGASPKVLIDEQGYPGFRRAAELCRATALSVPWDEEGPRLDAFERIVAAERPQLYCTSAEVQNPTTRRTSVERRHAIAAIARRHDLHILDDDCYRSAPHSGPSYRALLPDHGWYVTSPSKSLTPALRVGFALGPSSHTNALVRTATQTCFGVARVLTDLYAFVAAHPDTPAVTARLADWIADEVRAAVNVLGGFTLEWNVEAPFLWLSLPVGWRSGDFVRAAEVEGVLVRSAEDFSLRDGRQVHAVRLALNGTVPRSRALEGYERLAALLARPPEQISA